MGKTNEIYEHVDKLSVIMDIQEAFASKLSDTQAVFELAAEKIFKLFDIQALEIITYNYNKNLLESRYKYNNSQEEDVFLPHSPSGALKQVIDSRRPLLINKSASGKTSKRSNLFTSNETFNSAVYVPVIVHGQVSAVISLKSDENKYILKKSDLKLLSIIASLISSALAMSCLSNVNLKFQKEIGQRTAELAIISSVGEAMTKQLDMATVTRIVGDKVRDIFHTEVAEILLLEPDTNMINIPYSYYKEYQHPEPFQLGEGLTSKVINSRQPLVLSTLEEMLANGAILDDSVGEDDKTESYMGVPIIVGDKVLGVVSVQNYHQHVFDENSVRLLSTLSSNMGVALENARLFEETRHLLIESEQRTAELSILNTIQQGLVMEMSFEGIINLVGDKLREALNFQDIGIRIYNKETNLFYFLYEYEHGEKLILEPTPPGAISGWVLNNKKMLFIRKNDDETLKSFGIEGLSVIPGTDRSKSLVALPIMSGDEVCGMFAIEDYEKEDAFSESDARLFTTIASSMSIALENARLFEETKRLLNESNKREAELSMVNSISQALTTHLELDKLIDLVGNRIKDLFRAQIVYLALLDKETNMINFPFGYGDEFPPLPLGEGLTSKIILTGQPLLINRKMEEKRAELGVKRVGIPASSYLGVPIPFGQEIIGVISIQSTEQENYFSEDDMRLLNTIAANIGVALNNAEAYQKLNSTVEQLNIALNDLKSTQQQLIVQEKLASLGTLTAGIAHEIKNPLNFVNNFAEISIELIGEINEELEKLKAYIPEGESDEINELLNELKDNAVRINQHGKRADSIVRSMLLHSRGKAGEKQVSDINAILEEDLNLAYHGMRARDASFNVTIERDFDTALSKIPIVPQDISRVFINVINNGFYEVNKKGKIIKDNFRPAIWVTTKDLMDRVEIRIKDNGNGIPPEVQDKLFNPFFTTKPSGEGTGLGLSLSYDIIVKQHQGDIRFESVPGIFTEFIISLPKNLPAIKT